VLQPGCWHAQEDVVEAQSAELAERLAAARDVKGVEAAHAAFLDACCQQCFLDSQPLAQALQALYALCMRVCALVAQAGTLPMRAPASAAYHAIRQKNYA
jgi:hypothetical protein